jgi:transcriptional regulator with XRE-family HTH domain
MPRNVVGSQIRKLRDAQGWSQETLAARCGRLGWDISRGTLAKVEAQVRCVSDEELMILAKALGVKVDELYPASRRSPKG